MKTTKTKKRSKIIPRIPSLKHWSAKTNAQLIDRLAVLSDYNSTLYRDFFDRLHELRKPTVIAIRKEPARKYA